MGGTEGGAFEAEGENLKATHWRATAGLIMDYALVAVGAVCVALAADLFLIPNQVISGGVVGVATILRYTLGTPVGLITLLINVPLLLAGLRWAGGRRFAVRTGLAVLVLSLALDLLPPYLPEATSDPLLYTLYGGLLDGLGMGLVFRAGGHPWPLVLYVYPPAGWHPLGTDLHRATGR